MEIIILILTIIIFRLNKLPILFLIEICWNIYPSTFSSSFLLHCLHAIISFLAFKCRVNRTKNIN
uniref:Candidate secreted effector n=1 Tax=Meloidogyne incognita TaxID=6306 RepID=A0A914MYE2_MELIC